MKSRTKKVFPYLLQQAKPQNTNSENRASVNVSETTFWCFWTTFFSFFQSPSIHCSEISWARGDFYVRNEAQGISLQWTFCMEFKGKCRFLASLCQVVLLLGTRGVRSHFLLFVWSVISKTDYSTMVQGCASGQTPCACYLTKEAIELLELKENKPKSATTLSNHTKSKM